MLARGMSIVGGLLSLLLPALALGWPVDQRVSVEPGQERFQKLTAVDWVEVEDPSVVSVEAFAGSGELLLTGKKPGRTLALLYAEGRFAVWRITVGPEAPEDVASRRAAAAKACPDLKDVATPERSLSATVKDAACRGALSELFRTDAYVARELELTFEVAALQEQLAAFSEALPPGVTVRYSGAGLVMSGKASAEAHHKALWGLFRRAVGRVPLEDRVEVEAPAPAPAATVPDAGTVTPPTSMPPVAPAPKRKPAR
ncbi:pilus assembly protein N-terminal domain-containing protein [Corallococcus sp. M34]|uniref:pilus assembly protein N-terminal domain-containing protein n=1 Tax=Citreicoccus inhibens TaxID=2849499 RepID=UPI001C2404A1|nr:pilus assembly protein N-terminal domain-containing protein [Citreicoccus inhibens]MBU8900494.1 pilus assembly protein N-terminal domain-containing protein [Citreicoccus inhibens]